MRRPFVCPRGQGDDNFVYSVLPYYFSYLIPNPQHWQAESSQRLEGDVAGQAGGERSTQRATRSVAEADTADQMGAVVEVMSYVALFDISTAAHMENGNELVCKPSLHG